MIPVETCRPHFQRTDIRAGPGLIPAPHRNSSLAVGIGVLGAARSPKKERVSFIPAFAYLGVSIHAARSNCAQNGRCGYGVNYKFVFDEQGARLLRSGE